MVKILGICASPRKGGNSDLLLEYFLKGARHAGGRTNKIFLDDLRFSPCRECGSCRRTGVCILRDDMRRVYKAVEDADIIAVSSPIFFGSLSAQAKMMIDRFQPHWARKELLKWPSLKVKKRIGVFLCVSGANRRDFFDNAKKIIRIFFAVIGVKYTGEIYSGGTDRKGEIKKRKNVIKQARALGEGLVKNY